MNPTHKNETNPADLAPLSYGPGLAIGLWLILGLPGESRPRQAGLAERSDFVRQTLKGGLRPAESSQLAGRGIRG